MVTTLDKVELDGGPFDPEMHITFTGRRGGRSGVALPLRECVKLVEALVVEGLKYSREFAGEMRAACDAGEERARQESMR